MLEIVNVPRKGGKALGRTRCYFEHRAEWLYLVLDEARKKGLAWEGFAGDAILRCGRFHGGELASATGSSLLELRRRLFSGWGRRVFEMEVKRSDERELRVEFRYCPLVAAWKRIGASDADIGTLCDIAMRGDAGIAEAFGARLELGQVIAKGGRVCEVGFVKEPAAQEPK
jgi:hypothetical protein